MKYRELRENDIEHVKELHARFFNDFNFPDFLQMLCAFAITDDNDKIIIAGGVKVIGESLLVTDVDGHSNITIGRALVEAQSISRFICKRHGIEWLHAFVKDESYAKHLIQHGFSKRCQALSMKV